MMRAIVLVFATLLLANATLLAGPSFVQVKSATATSGSSIAVTYPAAQTAGNLNVVAVMWGDTTSAVNAVTDSKGNAYTLAVGPSKANGLTSAIYYAKNIVAGSNTVTVTFNQAAGWPNVNALEYSGLDTANPLDVVSTATGTGTTANSGSATTTSATELIVGAGNPLTTFTAAGSGFSNRIINSFGGISEDKIVTSTGSYNATATMTSGGWVMQMAAFRGSAQGGSNPALTVSTISPATGTTAGGTAVTITGTGFLAGATVKLGGTAATGVNVASSTSITATTPAHTAGAVNVVVTNTDSQSGTLANGYTYSNPAPTVGAISPNTGTANGGAAVTITGTGFQSGATVTIGGTAATGVTVVSSTSITAKTAAHAAGAANVVVKNTDNQTGALSGGYTYTSATGGGSGAPAGATFYDDFSKGSLDTSKWIPSNWGAPGGGTFVPSYLDFSTGMLRIKVTQTYNSSGGISSVGGELQSKNALGFGTYEWVMRAASTSTTPNGSGYTVSGQISSGFIYVNNSQTEIDSPEIEGQNPGTLWWTTWTSVNTKQYTSTQAPFAPESGFHSYKCVWTKTSIKFYVDGVLVSTHTGVVPQTPAYAMINHWGTNSKGWGGLATPNITRYMFVRSFSFVPAK